MKSEVNGDNFQEVCKKSREVKIRDGKGRPWERKAKIGEIVPGGDYGACLLKVLLWEGRKEPVPGWGSGTEGWKVLLLCGSLV